MNPETRPILRRLLGALPSVAVFAALGGLALLGHRTGWKVPKFGTLFAHSKTEKEDWCETHNVPDSRCIACHPELGGGDAKDWCKEHGVPESKCTVCHPEILTKGKAADWCREHGVPESQCTLCHPEIVVKGQAPKKDGEPAVTLAPGAKPAPNPLTCQTHLLRVQFASVQAVRKAGVELGAVEERPIAATVSASGEIDYDQTHLAKLAPRVPGILARVEKEIGQEVKKGEVLALVDAADIGRAKGELLQALASVEVKEKALKRVEASSDAGFRTQAEREEAEAAVRESRIRLVGAGQTLTNLGLPFRLEELRGKKEGDLALALKFLGLPEATTKSLDPALASANLIPVQAPFDGVIVSREGVAGELADPSKPLFVVADIRKMWVMLDVRLEDARTLALGQRTLFRPDGDGEDAVPGKVGWIGTAVDEKTRTVRVRAEVENPEGRLRAKTFGTSRITVRESEKAIAVPSEAVHWEGCCHIVFVRLTDEIFQTRKVRLGARAGGFTEILVGVVPGEVVATRGSHVLKADILKSKLGAGCVDD